MLVIITSGLGGYLLLCLLIARYRFDNQNYYVPTIATLFYEEAMTGFIAYPFNICFWIFRIVTRLAIKINKNINKWLDKVA
jgi:hypothetical protein